MSATNARSPMLEHRRRCLHLASDHCSSKVRMNPDLVYSSDDSCASLQSNRESRFLPVVLLQLQRCVLIMRYKYQTTKQRGIPKIDQYISS